MTIDSVKSSNISQDISQSSNTPKDISKSSFLDQGWAIGLRALAPTRWGENLKNVLGEFFHSPLRLSYNPDTLLNKFLSGITAPVRALSQALGWSKPTPSPPKEMYSGAYQSIKADSNNSTIEIPGYNDFKELNRSVQISSLNSNSNGKPKPEKLLALGLQSFFNPEKGALGLKAKLGEEDKKKMQELFSSLPPNLQDALKMNGSIQDSNTGLVTSVVYSPDDKKLHVIFGGTGAGTDAVKNKSFAMETEQYLGDVTTVGLLTSHVPPSYHQAQKLVGALKEVAQKNGLTLEVDGFSKGGGEAAYAGIYHEVKTLSHCGTALSPACQRSLGQEKIKKAVQNDLIFNTSVQGCFVTDQKALNNVARAWEQLTGLQVARHIGSGIRITEHNDQGNAHAGSFDIFAEFAEKKSSETVSYTPPKAYHLSGRDSHEADFKLFTDTKIKGEGNTITEPLELAGGKTWLNTSEKTLIVDLSEVSMPEKSKEIIDKIKTKLEENLEKNVNKGRNEDDQKCTLSFKPPEFADDVDDLLAELDNMDSDTDQWNGTDDKIIDKNDEIGDK